MRHIEPLPKVSYILVSYNGGDDLIACIDSIEKQIGEKEIILVDNASLDNSITQIGMYKTITIIELHSNLGVASAWNIGAKHAHGSFYIFITQDVILDDKFQYEILKTFTNTKDIGVIGSLLLYPNKRKIQHAGGIIIKPRYTTRHIGYGLTYKKGEYEGIKDQEYVTGAVMACRSEVFRIIDGFDNSFFPAYYEDVDFCFRVTKVGWRVVIDPNAKGFHRESTTLGVKSKQFFQMYTRNRYLYIFKHLSKLFIEKEFIPSEVNWIISLSHSDRESFLPLLLNSLLPDLLLLYSRQSDLQRTELVRMTITEIAAQVERQNYE